MLLLGPPGVGKTHLAIALALKAIENGQGAYFVRAYDLMEDLRKARVEHNLNRRLRVYLAPNVLTVDEFGIWPYDRESATAFFALVSARYERGSIILTSNKGFGEWGEMLSDNVIASTVLDRLLHHSHVLNIRSESYRLREKRQAGLFPSHQQLNSTPEGPATTTTIPTDRIAGQRQRFWLISGRQPVPERRRNCRRQRAVRRIPAPCQVRAHLLPSKACLSSCHLPCSGKSGSLLLSSFDQKMIVHSCLSVHHGVLLSDLQVVAGDLSLARRR